MMSTRRQLLMSSSSLVALHLWLFTSLHPWSGLEGEGGRGVMVSPSKGMATGRVGSGSVYESVRPTQGGGEGGGRTGQRGWLRAGEPRKASRISMWTCSRISESSLVPDFESNPESDQATRHPHPGFSRNPGRIKRAIRLHPSVTRLDSPGGTGVQGVGRGGVRTTGRWARRCP